MSAAPRALAVASRVAVVLWVGIYLAWPGRDAALEPAPEPAVARVHPVREEPKPQAPPPPPAAPEPAPAVEPPAEPPPAAPAPTRVGRAELAAGADLLDGTGDFPVLSCSYEDFHSFDAYARAMAALGARFVVVRNREIVGGVNLETGSIGVAVLGTAFSPRARDYTGEPGLAALARSARGRFGGGAVVMMLVPRAVDAGLFGAIARILAGRGERPDAYREIRGRYERGPGGGVRLRVDAAVRRDGSELPMDLLFDLNEIARLEASA